MHLENCEATVHTEAKRIITTSGRSMSEPCIDASRGSRANFLWPESMTARATKGPDPLILVHFLVQAANGICGLYSSHHGCMLLDFPVDPRNVKQLVDTQCSRSVAVEITRKRG